MVLYMEAEEEEEEEDGDDEEEEEEDEQQMKEVEQVKEEWRRKMTGSMKRIKVEEKQK